MNQDSNNVFHVYGFTQAGLSAEGAAAAPAGASSLPSLLDGGIDEQHPPFFWCCGAVAAVLSLVSRTEFCGPTAEENLQDLAWLAPRACRHEAVLEQVMRHGPVLPARFGTLFSSPESLGGFLRKHEAAIVRFLERVRCHEEWAVKGLLDPERAEAELLAHLRLAEKGPVVSSPGLAYLQEQGLRIKAKQELDDRLAISLNGLRDELQPLALEISQRRVLSRETTGAPKEMVLNWAFLVPRLAVADFRRRVERADAEPRLNGLAFEVSGPWPPYSFCPVLEKEPAREWD